MAVTLTDFRNQFNAPLRQGLIEIIDNTSAILPLLFLIPTDDLRYEFTRRSAIPTVSTRALGAEYAETSSTTARGGEDLAIMGGLIKIDNQIFNKKAGEVLKRESEGMAKAVGLYFDYLFFKGDQGSVATQFNGLNVRLTGNQVASAGANGANFTLAMLDDLIARVRGNDAGKKLLMNRSCRVETKQLMITAGKTVMMSELGGKAMMYGDVPIYEIEQGQTNADILGYDETQGTATNTASIYCTRFGGSTDDEDVQGLIGNSSGDVQYQGQRGTQHYSVLDANLGLGMFHPESAARLKGILKR